MSMESGWAGAACGILPSRCVWHLWMALPPTCYSACCLAGPLHSRLLTRSLCRWLSDFSSSEIGSPLPPEHPGRPGHFHSSKAQLAGDTDPKALSDQPLP